MHENPTIDRAIVLLETQRYADAEKILRQGLTQYPQDALALTLLAICQLHLDKKKDALTTMEQAVSLAPDEPFVLTTHGRILWHNNQMDAARQSLRSALQLDPTFSEAYSVITQIEYQQRNWQVALLNAEQGLEHDPENQALINFRAMALVKLKRSSEASETLDYALYNDPEDSFSHSNKGWVKLEQGHYGEAVASFKEALRFNPNSEHAREGLKEAIKGKNWLYRGILRYFLFMSKLSERNQWLVIIGLYIGVRFLRVIAQENSALRPFIAPILILYMVFVFATWIGQPLSNLILRLHPVGKFALTDDEKRFSNIVGTFLLFGLLAIVGSYWMADENLSTKLSILGITCFAMLIPIGGVSNMPEKSQARRWLGIYAVVMFVIGPLVQLLNAFVMDIPASGALLGVFGLGVFLYGWVANIVASRAAMRM
jgi:Tfp pilus assembly protein PilF